ncbi:MAG: glycosyltransferase family 2 protein [Spirochaetes bacterium]|nr:glycosyltransferase family 2 protein [Spirochaetota bacterium]
MQNTKPFFSIIIPAYNVEKYIARSISSVLNQSFQDFEIIIINDGSVDKTIAIIDGYAKETEKINVLNHVKNESQHVSRIDGVAASKGQYVLFLDSDDYFTDKALTILYNEIQKKPCYDFYEFGYIIQPSGKVILPSFKGKDRFPAYFSIDNYPAHTMWNKVYDSILLKKAFASLERIFIDNAEDTYESIVISYYAKNIYILKKKLINYSIGSGISTTYKDYEKTLTLFQSIKTMFDLVENFLRKVNQNVEINNLFYKFFDYLINNYIITQKNEEDKIKLFLNINNYFNNKIFLEYLYFNKKKLNDDLFSLINSIDYRLGQILLYPIKKIKHFLFKK